MKLSNYLTLVFALVVGASTIFSGSTAGQTSNGTIVGTILDKTGAAVPKATVKVSSVQFGEVPRVEITDAAGGYRFESLLPGTYTVTVTAAGFDELKVQNVQVKGSLAVNASGTLEVSSVKNSIVVEASAAQELQTESGSLGGEISKEEITNLPINSLNPVELVLTQPGVQDGTNQFAFTNGVQFTVNGTRPRANNFLIDGQDNNDNGITGQAFQTTNLQAVQEVVILTNSYSAEYGRGGGSVTNEISKTGTNDFHGDAWELNRNNSFAAIPAEQGFAGVTKIARDNENTFGFDIGGPIKHNKLFVFGTSQWDRDFSAAVGQTLTIPTAAGIATLKSLLPNPRVQLLLDSLGGLVAPATPGSGLKSVALGPVPGSNGVDRGSVQVNFFQRAGGAEVGLSREWRVRVDWNATPTDTLFASFRRGDSSLTPDFFNNPGTLPPFDTQQGGPAQAFTGAWTHTFSPQAVNEFRFSYSDIEFTFGETAATLASPLANTPAINFNGQSGLAGLGVPTGTPNFRGHKSYQFQDALSYTIGRHTFKFGGDVDFVQVHDGVPFNSRGALNFFDNKADPNTTPATPAYTDLANFIDNFTGTSGTVSLQFGNPVVQPFIGIYAPYAQDTWHLRPNFTVDLGLRYEYWGTVSNILPFPAIDTSKFSFGLAGATFPALVTAPQQGDKKDFAPRVGFAYTPHFWGRVFGANGVIRAGYGIFYDGIFTNIIDNSDSSEPNASGGSFTAGKVGRGLANATGLLASVTPTPNAQDGITSVAANIRNPLTQQWNLDIQRELPGNFIMTVAYVGTRGERLYANRELNPGINQADAQGNLLRMNPNFGSVVVRGNYADSIYHSGQFTLDRKFSHGLLLRGAYTYSKLIDDGSDVFTTSGGSTFPIIITNQSSDRGLSAFDRRHRFVGVYVWDVPYVHGEGYGPKGILSYITRGWSWSGTFTAQTGNPETIHDGLDFNGDAHSGNDRPSLSNPAAPFSSVGVDGFQFGFTATPGTIFPYRDCLSGAPTCVPQPASNFHFIIPATANGTLGRNTYIGPGQWFYNTGVARTFKLHERHQLQFRAEFFNTFNHPNLFTDAPGVTNSSGQNVVFDAALTTFGNFAQTIAGGRQMKFWLKYSF